MDFSAITGSVDAVKTAIKRVDDFVGRAFGPAVDEFGGWLGDKVKVWRLLNLTKTIGKVEERLPEGVSVDGVRRKLLAEWIDSASLEEDENLQDMWAGLLASAATGNEPHPSFISCLRQMSRLDALFLATTAIYEPKRPFVPLTFRTQLTELDVVMKRIEEDTGVVYTDEEIDVAIDNLSRLNLLHQAGNRQKSFDAAGRGGKRSKRNEYRNLDFITVAPSDLGHALLKSCSGPSSEGE